MMSLEFGFFLFGFFWSITTEFEFSVLVPRVTTAAAADMLSALLQCRRVASLLYHSPLLLTWLLWSMIDDRGKTRARRERVRAHESSIALVYTLSSFSTELFDGRPSGSALEVHQASHALSIL